MRSGLMLVLGVAAGGMVGFLLGLRDCLQWRVDMHELPRPLGDSVYEIGGALGGGVVGLLVSATALLGILLTRRARRSAAPDPMRDRP